MIYSVRTPQRRESAGQTASAMRRVYVCDVELPEQIARLLRDAARAPASALARAGPFDRLCRLRRRAGKPFHETPKAAFLRSIDISCYSLIALSDACRETARSGRARSWPFRFRPRAWPARTTAIMAPIKAALDSSLVFLAKSFSQFSRVRFNAVAPGLLKTSASAGIPGYVDAYLYAEQATLRKRAVETEEVANVAAFLLSPRSSGINAQSIVVDAGMSVNYFDRDLTRAGDWRRPAARAGDIKPRMNAASIDIRMAKSWADIPGLSARRCA